MHADDFFRAAGVAGDLGDRDRAGVRGEYRVRSCDLVDVAEDPVLEVLVFGCGLDDERGVIRTLELLTQLNATECLGRRFS